MSARGIRESTPPAALRPIDLGGPSSYHFGSKRDTMAESIAVRSTSWDRERTREQAEVDEAMQLLREDGVTSTSGMFFLATMLFNDSVTQRVFKNLLTSEEHMAWLTYQMNKNNK